MAFDRSELSLMAYTGVAGGRHLYFYLNSAGDDITAGGFFDPVSDAVSNGDLLYDVDSSIMYATAVADGAVTVTAITSGGGGGTVAWADITDKPDTFAPTIGTTATTAKAGNYQPTWAQVTGKPTEFPATAASVETAVSAKTEVAALTPVADPSTATAEDVANAVNAVIAALQA